MLMGYVGYEFSEFVQRGGRAYFNILKLAEKLEAGVEHLQFTWVRRNGECWQGELSKVVQ